MKGAGGASIPLWSERPQELEAVVLGEQMKVRKKMHKWIK